ncbi:DOPA 4,5-dioxygenase family protein [Marinomonas epiphytica]
MINNPSPSIRAYHAHLYFHDKVGLALAKQIAERASQLFPVQVGHFHERPVGPHPVWSCQLSFAPQTFAQIVPWLMLNRQNLDVFLHPVTGNNYLDHTQGIAWLGQSYALDISRFIPI